jgi:hypothetical protein
MLDPRDKPGDDEKMRSEETMKRILLAALLLPLWVAGVSATELNPAAVKFTLPDNIPWKLNPNAADQAVLLGDPAKEGLYIYLVR